MAWELDPDFALQSRVTFGRGGIAFWTLASLATIASAAVWSESQELGGLLLRPGLTLLFVALPYSAVQVLALERDGHFDQHRLAGRPPLALGAAVLAGSSWPLWMTGAVLLLCASWLGARLQLVDAGVVVSAGVAIALVLLVLPSGRTETWLLRLAVVIVAIVAVAATQIQIGDSRPFQPYAATAMVTAAAVAALVFPFTIRRLYRPASAPLSMPKSILRPVLDLGRTRTPELSRALLGTGVGAAGAGAIAIICVALMYLTHRWSIGRDTGFPEALVAAFLYGPLLLAAYNCSTSSARERHTGAIDRMVLTDRPWRIALQLAAGFSLPFLAVSAIVGAAVIVLGWTDKSSYLEHYPVMAVLLIGASVAEGLRGRPVGLYIGAILLCAWVAGKFRVPELFVGVWIPWTLAIAALGRTGTAHLTGYSAVAAAAYGGFIAADLLARITAPFLVIAGALSLGAGLFVPDGRPGRGAGLRSFGALAAALGAALAQYRALVTPGGYTSWNNWPHRFARYETVEIHLVFCLMAGLYAAAGFMFGWLVHNLFGHTPGRSRMLRALPLFLAVFVVPPMLDVPIVNAVARKAGGAIGWSRYFAVDLALLAALLGFLIALMALEWRRFSRVAE
jgi:hypothetical protein